ncbi:MAG: sugar ABC transporter ATP-binding protein [Ostreibacterium sp.]
MNQRFLLQAREIKKSFSSVPALKNGQLNLRSGSVHALCGGNGAGKSTFLSILMGMLAKDAGIVTIDGKIVNFSAPADALKSGISMITQELEPIPEMTVAENILLGREPRRARFFVNRQKMNETCDKLLQEIAINVESDTLMRDLSLAQTQLVEIAKAISYQSRIIIMDEPTSAIGDKETTILFSTIRKLKQYGTGIIYVSHRLDELYDIADDYTIFRDGEYICDGKMEDINRNMLISTVLGTQLKDEFGKCNHPNRTHLLEINHFSRYKSFENITLHLYEGEVLGIFGLMGSGRSKFLQALFGLDSIDNGEIKIHGEMFHLKTPKQAIHAGMALVTKDRKESGLYLDGSVMHNITLAALAKLSRVGFIDKATEAHNVKCSIEKLSIKMANPDLPVRNLSGGNQQKVVLAKWMQTDPSLLLLDEPTRGVDVGAKWEIYHFMSEFAVDGKGIIMVSSDIPEILGVCDRVIVFKKGRISGELAGSTMTQQQLITLA